MNNIDPLGTWLITHIMKFLAALASALLAASGVAAQDPPEGWMAYAVGAIPQK